MNALKIFVAFAFLVACILAVQAEESQAKPAEVAPENTRTKRFPFAYPYSYGLGLGYHAPLAYHAPIAAAYHAPLVSAYHAPVYSAYSAYHAPLLY